VAIPVDGDEDDRTEELTHFEHAKDIAPRVDVRLGKKKRKKGRVRAGDSEERRAVRRPRTCTGAGGDPGARETTTSSPTAALSRPGPTQGRWVALFVRRRSHPTTSKWRARRTAISPPTNPIAALHRAGARPGSLARGRCGLLIMFLAVGMRPSPPRKATAASRAPPRVSRSTWEATGRALRRARGSRTRTPLAAYARYADERLRAKMPRGMSDPADFLASRTGG